MFCSFCGNEIDENASICVHCGRKPQMYQETPKDEGKAIYFWIGFLVPIAGFLVWIFTHDTTPNSARKALIGGIWGTVAVVLAVVLFYVGFFALMFFGLSQL